MKRFKSALLLLCLLQGISPIVAQESVAKLIKAKHFDAAEAICRKAIDVDPNDSKALVNLGLCLEGQNRKRDAIDHWSSLIGKTLSGAPTDQQLRERCLKLRSPETMAQAVAVGVEGGWVGLLATPESSDYKFSIELHKTGVDEKGRITFEGSSRVISYIAGNHDASILGYVDDKGNLCLAEIEKHEHRYWKNRTMVFVLTEQDKVLAGRWESSNSSGRIRLTRAK